MTEITWRSGDAGPVIVLATATLTYAACHYGLAAGRLERLLARRGESPGRAHAGGVLASRVLAGLVLGLAPGLVGALALDRGAQDLGLVPGAGWRSVLYPLAAAAVLGPIILLSARSDSHRRAYPAIRAERYPKGLLALNAGAWAVYLVGYESFFRGFLLLGTVDAFGVWPGIAVTTALYTFAHLPKPMPGETLGCIPMGILFAWLTLATGSVWPAVGLHLAIAVTSDTAAAHHGAILPMRAGAVPPPAPHR